MYDKALFVTAASYELGKRWSLARFSEACDRTVAHIESAIDAYDKAHPIADYCTGNIMCARTGKRHKDGCLGRVEPFYDYAKALERS